VRGGCAGVSEGRVISKFFEEGQTCFICNGDRVTVFLVIIYNILTAVMLPRGVLIAKANL